MIKTTVICALTLTSVLLISSLGCSEDRDDMDPNMGNTDMDMGNTSEMDVPDSSEMPDTRDDARDMDDSDSGDQDEDMPQDDSRFASRSAWSGAPATLLAHKERLGR